MPAIKPGSHSQPFNQASHSTRPTQPTIQLGPHSQPCQPLNQAHTASYSTRPTQPTMPAIQPDPHSQPFNGPTQPTMSVSIQPDPHNLPGPPFSQSCSLHSANHARQAFMHTIQQTIQPNLPFSPSSARQPCPQCSYAQSTMPDIKPSPAHHSCLASLPAVYPSPTAKQAYWYWV